MEKVVNVHEFKTHYSRYLAQVKQGKTVIVGERGKPVARLVPEAPMRQKPRKLGALKGKLWIADDFDEPIPDWAEAAEQSLEDDISR